MSSVLLLKLCMKASATVSSINNRCDNSYKCVHNTEEEEVHQCIAIPYYYDAAMPAGRVQNRDCNDVRVHIVVIMSYS
jgi:hypothetical protein